MARFVVQNLTADRQNRVCALSRAPEILGTTSLLAPASSFLPHAPSRQVYPVDTWCSPCHSFPRSWTSSLTRPWSPRHSWMNRAFSARLRHHSSTCFSRTVAYHYKSPCSIPTSWPSAAQLWISPRSGLHSLPSHLASLSTGIRAFSAASTTMNGTTNTQRTKRKQYPSDEADRPPKQHRPVNGKEAAEDSAHETSSIMEDDMDMEDLEGARVVPGLADTAEWQAAIEKVVRNVVSIRFCQTCAFDTDPALTSEATGFVVDAERGYATRLPSPREMC